MLNSVMVLHSSYRKSSGQVKKSPYWIETVKELAWMCTLVTYYKMEKTQLLKSCFLFLAVENESASKETFEACLDAAIMDEDIERFKWNNIKDG